LVCGGIIKKDVTFFQKSLFQKRRGFDGVTSRLFIKIICKQSVKLDAQKPALGEKGAVLFNHSHEMRRTAVSGEYYRFSAQCSRLGSSDVKYITEPRDIRKRKFVFRSEERRVGKECSMQWQTEHEKERRKRVR